MAGSGSSRERARAEELLGRTISGRYRIESLLAAGGTGAVFRGEHLKMRKRVAIKVLHAELEGLMVLKEQFEREAIAGAHVSHPHVASATDMGKFGSRGWEDIGARSMLRGVVHAVDPGDLRPYA